MNNKEIIFDMIKGQYSSNKDIAKNKTHEGWACIQILTNKLAEKVELVETDDKEIRKSRDAKLENPNKLMEIKKDAKCFETGNIFIEMMSRDNPSGLSTTKADWWFQSYYCSDGKLRTGIAETEKLKELVGSGKYSLRTGGDKYKGRRAAEGFVVPWRDYHAICFHTLELDAVEYIKQIGLYDEFTQRCSQKQNPAW